MGGGTLLDTVAWFYLNVSFLNSMISKCQAPEQGQPEESAQKDAVKDENVREGHEEDNWGQLQAKRASVTEEEAGERETEGCSSTSEANEANPTDVREAVQACREELDTTKSNLEVEFEGACSKLRTAALRLLLSNVGMCAAIVDGRLNLTAAN